MGGYTLEELRRVITTPDPQLDAFEIHLKRLWENGQAGRVFTITGLDTRGLCPRDNPNYGLKIVKPEFAVKIVAK